MTGETKERVCEGCKQNSNRVKGIYITKQSVEQHGYTGNANENYLSTFELRDYGRYLWVQGEWIQIPFV